MPIKMAKEESHKLLPESAKVNRIGKLRWLTPLVEREIWKHDKP
jgi:hypothetical protein